MDTQKNFMNISWNTCGERVHFSLADVTFAALSMVALIVGYVHGGAA